MQIEGFEVHGITWANRYPLYQDHGWDIQVGLGLELLYGTEAQEGYAIGSARANATNDYDFVWQSDYTYTENYLYDLDVPQVTSFGYTTHLSLQASYKDFTFLGVINDLWGRLYWKNLPYSDVTMSSGNKSFDENGYVEYAPLISGVELEKDFTQRLMRKWRIEGQYKLEDATIHIGNDHIYGVDMPYVCYAQHYQNELLVRYSYESTFDMLGVDARYKHYHFGIHSNGLKNTSAIKASFGLYHTF
jgi:hypothetical protein